MYKLIEVARIGDLDRGYLSYFESNKECPFDIKRLYYIYGVPQGVERGAHAHKELKQAMVCMSGSVKIVLTDGSESKSIILDSPHQLLIINPGLWRDVSFLQPNSVLLVAANDYYEEEDYIRDYDDYLKYIRKGSDNEGTL